jgi:protein ImuA
MVNTKAHIIAQLQKNILLLQGFKPATNDACKTVLNPVRHSFPNSVFPSGAIHDFLCSSSEEASASCGFIAGILSSLMKRGGISLWIHSYKNIFPPALKFFGIDPEKLVFVHLNKDHEKIWAMEEALKCNGLSSVVGEINEIGFTESRRFQLAVEQSKVTGFLIRRNPKHMANTCVTRWKISPVSGMEETDLPGLGFPRWHVELLKVRNGKPGCWQMEWREGNFQLVYQSAFVAEETERKII